MNILIHLEDLDLGTDSHIIFELDLKVNQDYFGELHQHDKAIYQKDI